MPIEGDAQKIQLLLETLGIEGINASLGGPAGMGMAIGAIAFALAGVLPKLEKFFDRIDVDDRHDQGEWSLADAD